MEEELFDPICLPKNSTTYFPTCSQSWHSICKAGRKKRQCGLCLGLIFSGEHYNQLLPSQTSFPVLCDEKVIWLYSSQNAQMRDSSLQFLCLHSQIRATHWIYFLSGLSISKVYFFCFGLPWQCVHQRVSRAGLLCNMKWSESHLPFTLCGGWNRANECS